MTIFMLFVYTVIGKRTNTIFMFLLKKVLKHWGGGHFKNRKKLRGGLQNIIVLKTVR